MTKTGLAKVTKIAVVCMECGRRFKVSPNAADPRCAKCGSVDLELADEGGAIG
jgi:rRNA maturation endonuclease Nob1